MKRLVNSMVLAAAAVAALAGCAKETVSEQASSSGKLVDVKFTAEIPAYQTTKSTVDVNGLTFNTRWADGDKMGLSYAYGESTPKTEGENIQATYSKDGSYTVKLPEYTGAWEYYVYYPYQTAITSSKSVEIPFGAERTQNGNSINSDYDLMQAIHAVTNGVEGKDDDGCSIQFEMERLTSLLYFHFTSSLTETVQKATLTVDGDPIAAEKLVLHVDMTNYTTSYVSGSTSNSIVLNLTDVTADDFMLWFNILPYGLTSQGIKNIKLVVETETKTFSITNPNSELDLYKAGQVHSINLNIPDSAWKDKETPAPPVTTPVYEKVTSALTDWSGDYLIVYEDASSKDPSPVAFDGSLIELDKSSNTKSVVISDNKIEATAGMDAISFTIATIEGGYSIKSASGHYIGRSSYSNGLEAKTTPLVNTISYDGSAVALNGTGAKDGSFVSLKFNKATNQARFRYFASAQQAIALYKRSESLPKAPFITLTPESGSVAADATSASFAVKSNVDWTVSTDAGWVTLGATSGSNDGTVALSFTANAGEADRTATVTVKSADDAISQTYTLIQKAKASSSVKTLLFSEGFGKNTSSARAWKDDYKEQGGILSVYSGASYTISQAKQSKNTVGQKNSGLSQGSNNVEASFIVGPLSVAQYERFCVSYYWKAGSTKGTYYTKLYYSIDGTNYTEVSTNAKGATTFVEVNGELPSLDNDNLYLKIIFCTSNTQAVIDEVKLYGYSK